MATEGAAPVQTYLEQVGNKDLVLDEVMEFQYNFYALVQEKSTGRGAFELLLDRVTGAVFPEHGPNMMWNTKYGMMAHMGGMMGYQPPTGSMTVSADQAKAIAHHRHPVSRRRCPPAGARRRRRSARRPRC